MADQQARTLRKMKTIIRVALELFTTHGMDKVSMDEIAARANVSKVTIYKYFGSKEQLYSEVIDLFIEETLAASEAVLNSDIPFLDKLKFMLEAQTHSSPLVSMDYLFQIWEEDNQTSQRVQERVKAIMFKFYEEGKAKAYIKPDVSFESLYLYAEIFRAGLRATSIDTQFILVDRVALDELYRLFFFGFINESK